MLFCENCNNLLFINPDIKKKCIYLNCGNCNFKRLYSEEFDEYINFSSNRNIKFSNVSSNNIKNIKYDPALPVKTLYCNNCNKNNGHLCLKYDHNDLKYIFECNVCNNIWSNNS